MKIPAENLSYPPDAQIPTNSSKRRIKKAESAKAHTRGGCRVESHDVDDVQDDDGRHSRTGDSENEKVVQFACPYFRRCPARYLECINLKMPRISDVKQHLKRRHTIPFQCSNCSKEFPSSELLQDHVRLIVCPNTSVDNLERVSPEAQKLLKSRFDRGLSPTRQWHKIWEILFGPNDIAPKPQLDGVFQEVTEILRGTWKEEGPQIISDFVQTGDGLGVCEDKLYPLLLKLLDKVEARFEQKSSEHPRQIVQDAKVIFSEPTYDSEREFVFSSPAFLSALSDGCQSIFDMPIDIMESPCEISNSKSEMARSICQVTDRDQMNFQPIEHLHSKSLVSDTENKFERWQPCLLSNGMDTYEDALFRSDSGYCGDDDTLSTLYESEMKTR
ncbi:hypothetical protein FGRMN_5535 [Fusarium graminum]|nr:hypothetical protein FGRMN_5535 [Fusarium graminum]